MEILALGQARSKFRLRIQILKVHLALHKEEKKNYLRKLLELGFLFKFFFPQAFFWRREGKALWNRCKRETQSRSPGFRGQRCVFQGSCVPAGTFSQRSTKRVPIVVQRKRIQLVSLRRQVLSLALLSGLRIPSCCELWCRLAATALF